MIKVLFISLWALWISQSALTVHGKDAERGLYETNFIGMEAKLCVDGTEAYWITDAAKTLIDEKVSRFSNILNSSKIRWCTS